MNKRQRLDRIEARAKAIADRRVAQTRGGMTRTERNTLLVRAIEAFDDGPQVPMPGQGFSRADPEEQRRRHEEFLKVWRLLQADAGIRPASGPPGDGDGKPED